MRTLALLIAVGIFLPALSIPSFEPRRESETFGWGTPSVFKIIFFPFFFLSSLFHGFRSRLAAFSVRVNVYSAHALPPALLYSARYFRAVNILHTWTNVNIYTRSFFLWRHAASKAFRWKCHFSTCWWQVLGFKWLQFDFMQGNLCMLPHPTLARRLERKEKEREKKKKEVHEW